jgi:hypothetical protein
MTVALRPAIMVPSGAKLVITLVGQPLSELPSPPLTAVIAPSQGASTIISSSRVKPTSASIIEIVFGSDILAETLLIFSLGTFRLPATALPSSAVDAAILDVLDNVIAASSQGSFPAIFSSAITGSSVGISSSVANAPRVTVSVTFSPTTAIAFLRLSGLTFLSFTGNPSNRRLLQSGASCTNLAYSVDGALAVTYIAAEGDLSLMFPGGSASRINEASPCVCQISGFRNPAAAAASPGIMVTTYDNFNVGLMVQSGLVFPPILCEPGYSQSTSNNAINCVPCAKGTYSDTPGAAQCLQCPPGTYGNTTAAASLALCIACPPSTFSDKSGASDASACNNCHPGTSSSTPGAAACAPCAAGSYAEFQGQLFCDLCQAGFFGSQSRSSSRMICVMCPVGTYSKNGSMTCSQCLPGTSSQKGSGDCQPCLAGEYSEVGECFKCPGISYSLKNGSASLHDCSGVLVGGRSFAVALGLIILIIYILSFSLVPSWTSDRTIMRFRFTANFDGRSEKRAHTSNRRCWKTWSERVAAKRSGSSGGPKPAEEKRFFEVGDIILWESQEWALDADAVIGTVESTTVYHEQDADEFGDFDVFVRVEPLREPILQRLQDATNAPESEKPIMIDSRHRSCRCQLKEAPESHARLPLLGCNVGRWEVVRQINACFQLLLMSLFPALDTISDLVYVLSSEFANYYIFAASLFFITGQFWFYVKRLKQHRVFEALKNRRIDNQYLYGMWFWPQWARVDSLLVLCTMILPVYLIYYVIFPIVWFFLGYAIYSFQLFPITRISNRWLFAFVLVAIIFAHAQP